MALVSLNKDAICYEFDPVNSANHLGTGGMGVVFKGRRIDTLSGHVESVAIKVLFRDLPPESIARAKREASIQIEHENVIRMYGSIDVVDKDNKVICHVISEYLDGETLDKRSDEGEVFSKAESVKIVKCILSGLYSIHNKGYIHRDIDPSNVMMCKDGRIKIIDFGIVRDIAGSATDVAEGQELLTKGTQVGKFIGKVLYASPEQAQGLHSETDKRSDVYSVGVLLYQLLTGRVPFEGNTIYEIIKQHIESPIVFDNKVDVNLQHIIEKATAKSKEDRYQSVSEFIVDLEKYENGQPIPPPFAVTHAKSTQLKQTWLVAGIIVLIIVGFTGGGIAYLSSNYNKAIEQVHSLVRYGCYDEALDQYQDVVKSYTSKSDKNDMNILIEAMGLLTRYNNTDLSDSLLVEGFVHIGDRGFGDGYYYAAEFYLDGVLVEKNQAIATEYLLKGVNSGSILSTYRLGEAYANGDLGQINEKKANKYFSDFLYAIGKYDIKNLSPELHYICGKIYRYGYSVEPDANQAKRELLFAVKSNHPAAYYELYLLQKESNETDAEDYLNEAVKCGYTKAEYDYAMVQIENGAYEAAIKVLEKTIAKKYTPAYELLALANYKIAQTNRGERVKYEKYIQLAIANTKDESTKLKWEKELKLYLSPKVVKRITPEVKKPVSTPVSVPVPVPEPAATATTPEPANSKVPNTKVISNGAQWE